MRTPSTLAAVGLAVLAAGAAPALAAQSRASSREHHFTETEAGIQLSTQGNRFEDTFKIKTGPFGAGAAIRDATYSGTRFPASAHVAVTSLYKDGRLLANETLTYAAPATDGVGVITGTGTCSYGTYRHQGETCTYTVTGNYDLVTGRVFLTLHGTYTPSSTATTKHK